MRNFSINFCDETEIMVASVDGYETYRTKSFEAEGTDEGEKLKGFNVQVKSEVDETWGAPEDVQEFHTEFFPACVEIMERLTEELRWIKTHEPKAKPRTAEQKAVEEHFMGNVLDIFKRFVLKRMDDLGNNKNEDHFEFLEECLSEFEEISDEVNLEANGL